MEKELGATRGPLAREEKVYDKTGREIMRGDIVKVFHFTGARRKRYYMYKQCLGVATYPHGGMRYVFFSHLNFKDQIGERDGPYHEELGKHLPHYEIVQSAGFAGEGKGKAAGMGQHQLR